MECVLRILPILNYKRSFLMCEERDNGMGGCIIYNKNSVCARLILESSLTLNFSDEQFGLFVFFALNFWWGICLQFYL